MNEKLLILGGGSNLLFSKDFDGIILKNSISGIKIISDNNDSVIVEVGAGENWHEFVIWCLKHNYGGIENLALIPGSVGAAPIQNIGAYGSEVSDFIEEVICFDMESNSFVGFTNNDCKFSYRQSTFQDKDSLIVVKVKFKLTKEFHPNLEYED